jgi:exportin-7
MFYLALGHLLLVELGEDEEKFERFMAPLTSMWKEGGSKSGGNERGKGGRREGGRNESRGERW